MQVFELGGDVVAPSLAHDLMRLIAEGAGEGDDEADAELRAQAAASYLQLLSKPKLPNILLKVPDFFSGCEGHAQMLLKPERYVQAFHRHPPVDQNAHHLLRTAWPEITSRPAHFLILSRHACIVSPSSM